MTLVKDTAPVHKGGPAPEARDGRTGWGYLMWGLAALFIAVPELLAAWRKAPWPTISATVGHLEGRWSWVALIVTAVIVVAAYYGFHQARKTGPHGRRRNTSGRLTNAPAGNGEIGEALARGYMIFAALVAVAGGLLAWVLTPHGSPENTQFLGAYILYPLIVLFWVVIPSVAAAFFKKDVPFLPLFRTVRHLEERAHWFAVVVMAGLVILLIHLTFYPWPGIISDLHKLHCDHAPAGQCHSPTQQSP